MGYIPDEAREMMGFGAIVNIGQHGGSLRRPVEAITKTLDEYGEGTVPYKIRNKNTVSRSRGPKMEDEDSVSELVLPPERTKHEVLIAEALSLQEFGKLFKAPEFMDTRTARMLNRASAEIMDHLRAPVLMNLNTLNSGVELEEAVRKSHEADIQMGMESLRFLDLFSEALTAQDDVLQKISIKVTDELAGGIKIKFSPKESSESLGYISGDTVNEVEIIIRTGENEARAQRDYTPMQLNFRFLNSGEEIRSLRVDMHNQNKGRDSRGREKRLIQVDAVVGGILAERSSKHKNIGALCEQEDPEEAFKELQYVFLSNLVREKLTRIDAKGLLQLKENVFDADTNRDSTRKLGLAFRHGEELLVAAANKRDAVETIAQ